MLLSGPVVYTTSAQMIAPCVVVKGTLSITSAEMYFEVDEDDDGQGDVKGAHAGVDDVARLLSESAGSVLSPLVGPVIPAFYQNEEDDYGENCSGHTYIF